VPHTVLLENYLIPVCNQIAEKEHLSTNALKKPEIMKTILSLLFIGMIGLSTSQAESIDNKKSSCLKKEVRKELIQLFNEHDIDRPTHKGSVVALVKVDSQGKGLVMEIDSDDKQLQLYVKKQVESRNFNNLKNETIRLVVDFRN
jgi:hypothetical protein